jgi:hypothetical protein
MGCASASELSLLDHWGWHVAVVINAIDAALKAGALVMTPQNSLTKPQTVGKKYMKKIIVLFSVVAVSTAALAADDVWFMGGTLHKSTLREWKSASGPNQLATIGDIMCAVTKDCDGKTGKPRAIQIRSCVNDAASDSRRQSQSVAEAALICAIDAGYVDLRK